MEFVLYGSLNFHKHIISYSFWPGISGNHYNSYFLPTLVEIIFSTIIIFYLIRSSSNKFLRYCAVLYLIVIICFVLMALLSFVCSLSFWKVETSFTVILAFLSYYIMCDDTLKSPIRSCSCCTSSFFRNFLQTEREDQWIRKFNLVLLAARRIFQNLSARTALFPGFIKFKLHAAQVKIFYQNRWSYND